MSVENRENQLLQDKGSEKKTGKKGLFRRFRRDQKGVTAVEFGFIAGPFIFLLLALWETALVHMTSLDLENATRDASRQIRTGQIQGDSRTATDFKDLICDDVMMIPNCKSNGDLRIDVRAYEDFNINTISTDSSDVHDGSNQWNDNEQFQPGAAQKVVVVRAYYKMPLPAQIPVIGLSNFGAGYRLVSAVAVFRNEPF